MLFKKTMLFTTIIYDLLPFVLLPLLLSVYYFVGIIILAILELDNYEKIKLLLTIIFSIFLNNIVIKLYAYFTLSNLYKLSIIVLRLYIYFIIIVIEIIIIPLLLLLRFYNKHQPLNTNTSNTSNTSNTINTSNTSNTINTINTKCLICFENDISSCCVPCGHTYCNRCISNAVNCYMCRSTIREKINIYI